MVLKQISRLTASGYLFENDVKTYGTQTLQVPPCQTFFV